MEVPENILIIVVLLIFIILNQLIIWIW